MAISSERTIFTQISEFLSFRSRRLYNTFYNAQYSGKFALVLLFPGFFCFVRYRAETQPGYHIFISDESIHPNPRTPKWLPAETFGLEKFFAWKNGSKIYCNEKTTVADLKRRIFGSVSAIPSDVAIGCKGRMFDDRDNLAMAVRSFCKMDPRLVVWKEEYKRRMLY